MKAHTPYKAKDGDWYVYTGEDGDAIAIAMNGRGPNGGWTGISLARMELPTKDKTREFINQAAKKMAAAPEMLEELAPSRDLLERAADLFEASGNKPQAEQMRYQAHRIRAAISKASTPNQKEG